MRTRFYGHACLRIEDAGGRSIVIDPWFTREGAFFRSWFQFPENSPFRDEALAGTRDILVSHNHADHFDPETLKIAFERSPELRLHIARFATPWFRDLAARALPGHEDRIVEHDPWETFLVGDLEVFFVPEESPGLIDSAIIVREGPQVLVNLNDARLNTDQLERIRRATGRIDQLGLQASGASEYPVNYRYSGEDMRARKLEKRALKFRACEKVVDLLRPRRILFFAGPPCFLDPELADQNDSSATSVFPNQLHILDHEAEVRPDIAERSYFALPGEDLDDEILFSKLDREGPRAAPFRDPAAYVAAYRERRADIDFASLRAEDPDVDLLRPHFAEMAELSAYMNERIGGTLDFRVVGATREARFCVDFAAGRMSETEGSDPLYRLEIPAALAHAVARGEATWDDAFLSLRMVFHELTDRFVQHFKTFLKYRDSELFRALEHYEASASEAKDHAVVRCAGRRYRIQRHCPHAGVDLIEHGEIDEKEGSVICTAHRFRFDLTSGRCINAKGYEIETERLPD